MAPARGGNSRGRVYAISCALHGVGEEAAGRRASIWPAATCWRARSTISRARATRSRCRAATTTATRRSSRRSRSATASAPEQVATANGAAGANFQVCAALLEPGDDVLVERPGLRSAARRGAAARRERRPVRAALRGRLRARSRRDRARDDAAHAPHHHHVAAQPDRRARRSRRARGDRADRALTAGAHVLVDEVYLDAADAGAAAGGARSATPFISTSSLTKSYGLVEPALRVVAVLARRRRAHPPRARRRSTASGSIAAERLATLAFAQLDRLEAARRARAPRRQPPARPRVPARPSRARSGPARATARWSSPASAACATPAHLPNACSPSAARRSSPAASSRRRPISGWGSGDRARSCAGSGAARGGAGWPEVRLSMSPDGQMLFRIVRCHAEPRTMLASRCLRRRSGPQA